jgi:hypothetical protein
VAPQASIERRAARAVCAVSAVVVSAIIILTAYIFINFSFSEDNGNDTFPGFVNLIAVCAWWLGCILFIAADYRFAAVRLLCLAAAFAIGVSATLADGDRPALLAAAAPLVVLAVSAVAWSRRTEMWIYTALTAVVAVAGAATLPA